MSLKTNRRYDEAQDTLEYLPRISLIITYQPKMKKKEELEIILASAATRAEKDLMKNYPAEKAMPVINKLHHLIKDLNYTGHNKSIAIFVSPLTEKVYYFNHTTGANDDYN